MIVGLRSLILEGWVLEDLLACIAVIVVMSVVLLGLSLRAIQTYDR